MEFGLLGFGAFQGPLLAVYARQGNILEAQNLWKRVLDGEQVRGEVRRKYVEFLRGIGEDRQAEELHQKLERDGLLEAARQEIEMERRRLESAAQSRSEERRRLESAAQS